MFTVSEKAVVFNFLRAVNPAQKLHSLRDSAFMRLILIPFAALLVLLLDSSQAHAWGPVMHLQVGLDILRQADLLQTGLRTLLESFPYDFLYGCIGADIIFAKGLARFHEHSHNWDVGRSVLHEASSPPQQAFAYGYLSHLAADTVAHNHFIPVCLVRTYPARTLRHVYWEVRFDGLVNQDLWTLAREIARTAPVEEDELIERVVKRTLFSFKTDKRIFSGILVLHRMEHWQRLLQNLSGRSAWKLGAQEFQAYRALSLEATTEFLTRQDSAPCLQKDPIGREQLKRAKRARRVLRILERKGQLEPAMIEQALRSLHPDTFT